MSNQENSNELDLKELFKKSKKIALNLKKTFIFLFFLIMGVSFIFYFREKLKPQYTINTILRSTLVNKNQFDSYGSLLNESIQNNNENKTLPSDLHNAFIKNNVSNVTFSQINADLSDPDKSELMNHFKLNIIIKEKPHYKDIDSLTKIVNFINYNESKRNIIKDGKIRVEQTLSEVDSLIKVAFVAGEEFKNKMNNNNGSMVVISDLYKSVNEIIGTKKGLEEELFNYQTDNLVSQTSPFVLSKKSKFPLLILGFGFAIWIFICLGWTLIVLVFED